MATYFARKSGNINASDVWATTPSGTAAAVTFASGDVLLANSFTITVNVSTDLGATGEVRNDTTSGASAGGSFSLSTGVTLTANVFAATVPCVTLAGTASATVVGNITGGSSANAYGVNVSSTGTITITGACTGGTGSNAVGAYTSSNCTMNITGNVTAGTGAGEGAKSDGATSTVNITGNVLSTATAIGFSNRSTGAATITGTATGTTSVGVFNQAGGTLTIVGTAVGGTSSAGAQNSGAGTLTVTRAKGGATATGAAGVLNSTTGICNIEEIEFGDLGAAPCASGFPYRLTDKTSNVAVMYRFGTTKKTLTDPNASGLMPAASNVRFGTSYNGGNSTGTCYVPAASSVAAGVNVDNTVGTAVITSAAVQSACDAALAAFSSGRLSNVATVASVGQALSDALTPS